MRVYPKRKYLAFGDGDKRTSRIIYLRGDYADDDDFRGVKNPVGRISMSFTPWGTDTRQIVYDSWNYRLVGAPELQAIVELFYDMMADRIARIDAGYGVLNNLSWDMERRDLGKWHSTHYMRGISVPKYTEILRNALTEQIEQKETRLKKEV